MQYFKIFLLVVLFLQYSIASGQNDTLASEHQFISSVEKSATAQQIYKQGYNFYLNNKYSEAIKALDEAIQLKPFFPEAYFTRASVKEVVDDKIGALIDYETVIRQDENNREALFKIAHIHHQLGNYDECIQQLDELLAQPNGPTNAIFYKMDAGNQGVKEIMTMETIKSDFYNLRAQCYQAKMEFALAIADFDRAIAANEGDADLYVNRGAAYQEWGKPGLAEADFKKALQFNPWHKAAIFNLSISDDHASNQVMIDSYSAAIDRNNDLAEAYVNRGVLWFEEQKYQKALADFDSAANILANDAGVFLNRGLTYEKLGHYQLALKDFEEALKFGADASLVYGYKANALYHLRNYEDAEAFYTLAINLNEKASFYFNRGICRYHLQNNEGACGDFNLASQMGLEIAKKALKKYCGNDL